MGGNAGAPAEVAHDCEHLHVVVQAVIVEGATLGAGRLSLEVCKPLRQPLLPRGLVLRRPNSRSANQVDAVEQVAHVSKVDEPLHRAKLPVLYTLLHDSV